MAVAFTACEKELPRNPCYPTEEEKQTQKIADIKTIKKYFRDNKIDTTNMQVTASGIHYFNLVPGTGDQIKSGNAVEVDYIGKHLNGPTFDLSTTFDKSYGQKPFQFVVGNRNVIAGWDEALPLMKVGEETRFYIPSYLAYGPCGSGSIRPSEVLVFDIKVNKKLQ